MKKYDIFISCKSEDYAKAEPVYHWLVEQGYNPFFASISLQEDVVEKFIPALNRKTGRTFRLPTEAEWEYAARGGNKCKGCKFSGSDKIDEVAWYGGNSGGMPHPVKEKKANELGLYDMSGNVWEWCNDWYGDYSSGTQTDPKGSDQGSDHVLRGGSWHSDARYCRVSNRLNDTPDFRYSNLGFRLVLCPRGNSQC